MRKCPNPLKQKKIIPFTIPEIYLSNYYKEVGKSQYELKTAQLQLNECEPNALNTCVDSLDENIGQLPSEILLMDEIPSNTENYLSCDSIITLIFPDSKSLQYSLGRAHEDYEGKALKGPLKGINFPATHWKAWIGKDNPSENPLVKDGENYISELFSSIPKLIYVVACIKGDRSSLIHEWAHFFFYIDESYRKKVLNIWNHLDEPVKVAIEKDLRMRNYDSQVILDEFQAYLVETPLEFGKKWKNQLYDIHVQLKNAQPSFEKSKSGDIITILR